MTTPIRQHKTVPAEWIRIMRAELRRTGYIYENGVQQRMGSIPDWLALHSDGTISSEHVRGLPRTEEVESPVFLKLAPLSIVALNRIFGTFDGEVTVQGDEELYSWEEFSCGKIPRVVPWRQPYVQLAYAVRTTIAPADANVFGALDAERQSIVLELIERRMQLPNALDFVEAHGERAVEAHEATFNHALDALALACIQANTGQRAQRVDCWKALYAFGRELAGNGETVFEPRVITEDDDGLPTAIEVQEKRFWIMVSEISDERGVYAETEQEDFEEIGPPWVWPTT